MLRRPAPSVVRLEHVERTHVFEQCSDGVAQRADDGSRRNRVGHREGEIDRRRREARQRCELAVPPRRADEGVERRSRTRRPDARGRGRSTTASATSPTTPTSTPPATTRAARPGRKPAMSAGSSANSSISERVDHGAEGVDRVVDVDRAVVLDRPAAHRARHRHREVLRLLGQRSGAGNRSQEHVSVSKSATSCEAVRAVDATDCRSPGRTPVRSTDSSARSGFEARDEAVDRRAGPLEAAGETSGSVTASENPAPTSASATARRSRWRGVERHRPGPWPSAPCGRCGRTRRGERPPRRGRSRARGRAGTWDGGTASSSSSPTHGLVDVDAEGRERVEHFFGVEVGAEHAVHLRSCAA